MKLQVNQLGKIIDSSLPKFCSLSYAKRLEKKYGKIGVNVVVTRLTCLNKSAIVDNYFPNTKF